MSEYLERHFGPVFEQRTPRSYSALDPASSTGGPAWESQQGWGTAQASHRGSLGKWEGRALGPRWLGDIHPLGPALSLSLSFWVPSQVTELPKSHSLLAVQVT